MALRHLEKIKTSLSNKDIPSLRVHLLPLNQNRDKLSHKERTSLDSILALITAWEKAPKDTPASPPEKIGSQTTTVSGKPDKSSLDKKIDGAITQVRSWLSQAETWLGSQQKK